MRAVDRDPAAGGRHQGAQCAVVESLRDDPAHKAATNQLPAPDRALAKGPSTQGSSSMDGGAMDGPALAAYVRQVLIPEMPPGTVVILGNLPAHRNKEAAAALKAHGCWFLSLPPYSPDMNPAEQAFAKREAHL